VPVLVAADLGLVVAVGQRGENGLLDRRGELELRPLGRLAEHGLELGAVEVALAREFGEQRADRRLLCPPGLFVLRLGSAPFLRHGQVAKRAFVLQPGDPLGTRLEVQPQRSFDRDLAEAEVPGRIDPADDHRALLAVLDDGTGGCIFELGEQAQDVLLLVEWDLTALRSEGLAKLPAEQTLLRLLVEVGCVDELDLAHPRRYGAGASFRRRAPLPSTFRRNSRMTGSRSSHGDASARAGSWALGSPAKPSGIWLHGTGGSWL